MSIDTAIIEDKLLKSIAQNGHNNIEFLEKHLAIPKDQLLKVAKYPERSNPVFVFEAQPDKGENVIEAGPSFVKEEHI